MAANNWRGILEATKQLLQEHKANDITLSAVASAARVSRPTVYAYFADRDELLVALSEQIMDESFRRFDQQLGDRESDYLDLRAAIVGALARGDNKRVGELLETSKAELRQLFDIFSEDLHRQAVVVCRLASSSAVFAITQKMMQNLSKRMKEHSFVGVGVASSNLPTDDVLNYFGAAAATTMVTYLRQFADAPEELSMDGMKLRIHNIVEVTYRSVFGGISFDS